MLNAVDHHAYLTGYRGSGKSSVGKKLAELLNRPFIDLDLAIQTTAKKTIKEIFAERGELGFRDLEQAELEKVSALPKSVISLGGGAILREANRAILKQTGFTIWLQASPEVLWNRISQDQATQQQRPNLTQFQGLEEVRHVLAERTPIYQSVAQYSINVESESVEKIAKVLARLFLPLVN